MITLERKIHNLLPRGAGRRIAQKTGLHERTVEAVRAGKFRNDEVRMAYIHELQELQKKINATLKEAVPAL